MPIKYSRYSVADWYRTVETDGIERDRTKKTLSEVDPFAITQSAAHCLDIE